MVNGSQQGDYSPRGSYVTRDEFRPLVDRVNSIAEEHAGQRVYLKSMDENLQKISESMDDMVRGRAVNEFLMKWGGWTFITCATLITAHFTGIIHLLNKALS